jgi:two-component system alkaline phosphatase synthesis response regulator PhoP
MIVSMKKVLIIEDEIAFLKLMGDQLTKDGYEVIKADDGKKGLDTALSKHPDLILLDLRLPVMDGLTVLAELRKDAWGKGAKVIVLTNLEPDKDILDKVLVNKPALYLVKSNIKLSELKGKILNVLL